jgi:hypothetical protein
LNEMGDETDNCPAPLYKFFKDNEYKGDNLWGRSRLWLYFIKFNI